MKISTCMVMAFCLLCLIQAYLITASGFCDLQCPPDCKLRKNCDTNSCICSCDCSGSTQSPNPRQRPRTSPTPTPNAPIPIIPTFQYPRERPQSSVPDQIPCCVQASSKMFSCGIYIGLGFLDPTLKFGDDCCGVLKDLQECCVNGFIPSNLPRVNIYAIDLDAHC